MFINLCYPIWMDLVLLAKGSGKYRYLPPYKDTVQDIFFWVIITMHSFEFAWMILGAKGGGGCPFFAVSLGDNCIMLTNSSLFLCRPVCRLHCIDSFTWYAFTEMQPIRCDSHWLSVPALVDFLPVPYGLLQTVHKAACIVPYRYIHMALPHVASPRSAIHTTYHGRGGRLGWLFCLFRIRDILVRIQMRIRILGSVPGSVQINYESGCGSRRPKNIRIRRIQNTSFNLAEFPESW